MASKPTWISAEDAAFIQQGISITVASRDVRHVPSLSRALACRISPDGKQLEVVVLQSQSESLLLDLRKSAAIAVVFSQPTTHRSLQIKGSDAEVTQADSEHVQLALDYTAAFGGELAQLGFGPEFRARMFAWEAGDLRVVRFTPHDLYLQTPGPNAGARLEEQP